MARSIILPQGFTPRDYQIETMKAFFIDQKRYFIFIGHRRAGKDITWMQIMIAASQIKVGRYVHAFPKFSTARDAIWEGIDNDGIPYLDYFPKSLIRKINNTKCTVYFKNGSIYQLIGIDNFNNKMGGNLVGIVYTEYPLQNPAGADYISPILTANGGWQAYVYTPRGRNHGYYLYKRNKDNPEWFCQLLTVDDTRKNNGDYVISPKDIEEQRARGISEEIIQSEYYVSFDAAIAGAYFGTEMRKARQENRIREFKIDTTLPVKTYWDLGQRDKTVIWFTQKSRNTNEFYLIGYYEKDHESYKHYVNVVHDFRDEFGITYDDRFPHNAPHDARKTESDNVRVIDKYRNYGLNMKAIPRIQHKNDGIECARTILSRCHFIESACEKGIGALNSYHNKFDINKGIWGDRVHDWASDGADAFMQFAQDNQKLLTNNGRIILNAVNSRPVI